MRDREIDLVLYGATGFTGGLVAEYLAEQLRDRDVRWALGGRNASKLREVRDRLAKWSPKWKDLPLIEARSDDPKSLHDMTARTKVVASTVGPFELHGEPLVEACVDTKTDYVDITGEPPFWRRLIDRFHQRCTEQGTLVVPCCGFDSIPHDMGAWWTVKQLGPVRGPVRVRGYVSGHGKLSGGTFASALGIFANIRQANKTGGGGGGGGSRRPRPRLHKVAALDRWALPMPTIDPLVVRRSAMMSDEFPAEFHYEHYLQLRTLGQAATLVAGVGAVIALAQIPVARKKLADLRPSGSGPSEEERAKGKFRVTFFAETEGRHLRTEVTGHDPGYGHTSKMIAEAALCLVEDRGRLPKSGGVLTPASALGEPLLVRLEKTGMHFRVVESPSR